VFGLIERLIAEEGIECHWKKNGRFTGAWTPRHYAEQAEKVARLNDDARAEAYMVRANASARKSPAISTMAAWWWSVREPASGAVLQRPAGCLPRARRSVCARAPVTKISESDGGWLVKTARGEVRRTRW